jgi:hypothetical protein
MLNQRRTLLTLVLSLAVLNACSERPFHIGDGGRVQNHSAWNSIFSIHRDRHFIAPKDAGFYVAVAREQTSDGASETAMRDISESARQAFARYFPQVARGEEVETVAEALLSARQRHLGFMLYPRVSALDKKVKSSSMGSVCSNVSKLIPITCGNEKKDDAEAKTEKNIEIYGSAVLTLWLYDAMSGNVMDVVNIESERGFFTPTRTELPSLLQAPFTELALSLTAMPGQCIMQAPYNKLC